MKLEKRKFKPTTTFNQNMYTLQSCKKVPRPLWEPKSTFLKLVLYLIQGAKSAIT